MGTVALPNRKLKDDEVTEDVIDIGLRPGERVLQIDLEKQHGYITRMTPDPATGREIAKPWRDKDADTWRYRAVTIEDIDYEPTAGAEQEEVVDAQVVGELPPGQSREGSQHD